MSFEPFTFILEQVSQLLVNEVKLLATDKDDLLKKLQQQLELAQSFVRDVENQKQQSVISHVLETESQHIKRIIPQFEDYLDNLYFEEEFEKARQPRSIRKFMVCFSCFSNPLVHKHVVVDMALKLMGDLEDTLKRAGSYQRLSSIPRVTQRFYPRTQNQTRPNIMNEDLIVGLDEDVKTLVAKLKGTNGDRTTIFAIVGMSGSGKTTLARKLYNHEEIKRHFRGCLAWVCVSQEWNTSQLVSEISAQLHVPLTNDESMSPHVKLQEFLKISPCLVVLDDVWEMVALQELLPLLLPRGGRDEKGRVLITTQKKEILCCRALGGVYIHKARALNPEQGWELFSKVVRIEWERIRSLDEEGAFAKLGKEMLKRCNGLALAIVALAGLLSTKDTLQEWETVKNNVSSTIMRQNKGFFDYGEVKKMLELSYLNLPCDIKPCFIYLGIYPEDGKINVTVLIQLWISEGLLRKDLCSEDQTLEELGANFINELVQRCMVQVIGRGYGGDVKMVRVHDLMRDLCVEKARVSRLFEILSPSKTPSSSMELISRRIIIHKRRGASLVSTPHLRSVITFSECRKDYSSLELDFQKMKLLRVLHIIEVKLGGSAQQIGNLALLRYLSIVDCDGVTTMALESIKRLRNLRTFILHSEDNVVVPNDMVGSMEYLRFFSLPINQSLHVHSDFKFEGGVLGVGRSRSLQCLQSPAGEWLTNELAMIVSNLRKLEIVKINSEAQMEAASSFVRNPSSHLQVLELSIEDGYGLEFDLKKMELEACRNLKILRLCGVTRKEKGPYFFPPNLLDLCLKNCQIEDGGYLERALTQLHQLRRLLFNEKSYTGYKLTVSSLPQLQYLVLNGLFELKELRIEEGALPRLTYLSITNCDQLVEIPGITSVHSLQEFSSRRISSSLYDKLQAQISILSATS